GIEIRRKTKEQHITKEVEDRFFHCWIAALGRSDRAFHDLPIVLSHWLSRCEIRSINGKTSDGLTHGARKPFKCEIAIPSVLLGKPVEHVAQDIDVISQGQLHDLQFFCIQQVAKRYRVTNETVEYFCDRRFGRRIDQHLHHLISKIVAGSTV